MFLYPLRGLSTSDWPVAMLYHNCTNCQSVPRAQAGRSRDHNNHVNEIKCGGHRKYELLAENMRLTTSTVVHNNCQKVGRDACGVGPSRLSRYSRQEGMLSYSSCRTLAVLIGDVKVYV